jgi:hypothetical protein
MPVQTLNHTVAEIVRRLLVDLGVGTSRASDLPWSAYHGSEPPSPDNVITALATPGVSDGRSMTDGATFDHYGFQVRVRAAKEVDGNRKADEARTTLAKLVYDATVSLDSSHYVVHCFSRLGQVAPLGPETQGGRGRYIFTFNGQVSLKQVQ